MLHRLCYEIESYEFESLVNPFSNVDITEFNDVVYHDFWIQEDVTDVVDYLFYKRYEQRYEYNLGWCLLDGAKEFVKDIEDKYWHNKIDTYSLYKEDQFIEFLKEKYYEEAVEQCFNELLDFYDFSNEDEDEEEDDE